MVERKETTLTEQQQQQQFGKLQQQPDKSFTEFTKIKNDYKTLLDVDLKRVIHGAFDLKEQQDAIIWQSGSGSMLMDVKGEEYIDALGGLFNNHIGHGRREMAQAVFDQMCQLEFMASVTGYSNVRAIELSEKIIQIAQQKSGFKNMCSVFFCSGGSEANEAAFHLTLRYWEMKGLKNKTKMISFNNCYHGSSFVCASANPNIKSNGWERLTGSRSDNFVQVHFPNGNYFPRELIEKDETVGQAAARFLEETIVKSGGKDKVASFLFEPVQGDGGAVIPHDDFFPLARQICDKYDILMIADEVMTGFGKTGKWFAMEYWPTCQPDILTFAKGVSSGYLPVGGFMISNDVRQVCFEQAEEKWFHDYTYSAHPCCMVAALKNLEILERENLVSVCADKGLKFLTLLSDKLSGLPIVKDVRGAGLLLGIELIDTIASDIEKRMLKEEHIVVHAASNEHVVTLSPSFVTTEEQFQRIADGLYNVLSKTSPQQ